MRRLICFETTTDLSNVAIVAHLLETATEAKLEVIDGNHEKIAVLIFSA